MQRLHDVLEDRERRLRLDGATLSLGSVRGEHALQDARVACEHVPQRRDGLLVEREQLDVGPEAQLCQRSALLLLPAQLVLQMGHLLHDFALNRIHARVELGAWPHGTMLPQPRLGA